MSRRWNLKIPRICTIRVRVMHDGLVFGSGYYSSDVSR